MYIRKKTVFSAEAKNDPLPRSKRDPDPERTRAPQLHNLFQPRTQIKIRFKEKIQYLTRLTQSADYPNSHHPSTSLLVFYHRKKEVQTLWWNIPKSRFKLSPWRRRVPIFIQVIQDMYRLHNFTELQINTCDRTLNLLFPRPRMKSWPADAKCVNHCLFEILKHKNITSLIVTGHGTTGTSCNQHANPLFLESQTGNRKRKRRYEFQTSARRF